MAPDIAEKSGSTKEQEITVAVTVRVGAFVSLSSIIKMRMF
jgi:hypothetical protein